MDQLIRNVDDFNLQDRELLEQVLGLDLHKNQQLVISIVDLPPTPTGEAARRNGNAVLPDWCDVYKGLSDDEVAELEKTILTRADFSRQVK